MQRISHAKLLCVLVLSTCKTPAPTDSQLSSNSSLDLLCKVQVDDSLLMNLHVTTRRKVSQDNTDSSDTVFDWNLQTTAGTSVESDRLLIEGKNLINAGQETIKLGQREFEFKVGDKTEFSYHQQQGDCIQLYTAESNPEKGPRCNAVGTPGQGWYMDGRLLKHNKTCASEILSCGVSSQHEGWHIQKKIERIMVGKERCSWQKDPPKCTSKQNLTGWYLHDRLIVRDDECHSKSIECVKSPNEEGWFTFKRSAPVLFSEARCISKVRAKNHSSSVDSNR